VGVAEVGLAAHLPPARTQRSAAAMVHSAVLEVIQCLLRTWAQAEHAVLDGSLAGRALFVASAITGRSFAGQIPAAVNEFGINLTPGETVTITVGAGGAQGTLGSGVPGPGTANGGSGFINIEYYI